MIAEYIFAVMKDGFYAIWLDLVGRANVDSSTLQPPPLPSWLSPIAAEGVQFSCGDQVNRTSSTYFVFMSV
jgi:hypothetical protein